MVYESRVGDVFLLGYLAGGSRTSRPTGCWSLPRPGAPARMPFWKGDSIGRPVELGRAIGAFVREMAAPVRRRTRAPGATAAGLDEWAADNLLAYLREQREATRHVPDDRTILVERFRDELGDWRLVVHSPFGAQVNGPWALAIAARLRERRGVEVHASGADDGIVLRLPGRRRRDGRRGGAHGRGRAARSGRGRADRRRGAGRLGAVRVAVPGVRGPRPAAAPARPEAASPLWQQRQRAAQLLAVAGEVRRVPGDARGDARVPAGRLRPARPALVDARRRRAQGAGGRGGHRGRRRRSPAVLLFGYVGMFLYEADAPLAERRAAALSLDSTLLAELLGREASGSCSTRRS